MTDQLSLPVTEEWRVGQRKIGGLKKEELRSAYLDALDTEMIRLWRKRRMAGERAYVTADDARETFESWNPPPPDLLNRSFLAGLWQRAHWQTDGSTIISRTEGSHGNRLLRWIYRPERDTRERAA